MRISTRTCWLAAIALVLGIANGEVDTVAFDDKSFRQGAVAVHRVDRTNPRPHNFTWTSQNVLVEEIKIHTYDPNQKGSDKEIGSKKANDSKLGQTPAGPDSSTLQPAVQTANGQEEPSDGTSRRRGRQQETTGSAKFENFIGEYIESLRWLNNIGMLTRCVKLSHRTPQGGYPSTFWNSGTNLKASILEGTPFILKLSGAIVKATVIAGNLRSYEQKIPGRLTWPIRIRGSATPPHTYRK